MTNEKNKIEKEVSQTNHDIKAIPGIERSQTGAMGSSRSSSLGHGIPPVGGATGGILTWLK